MYKFSYNNNLLRFSFLAIAIYVFVYLIIFNFSLVSPRGFPLNPTADLFSINDYSFYKSFADRLPDSLSDDLRAPPLFVLIILTPEIFGISEGSLTYLSSLISLFMYVAVALLYKKVNLGKNFPFLMVLSPYLFYFSIFPSSDIYLAFGLIALAGLVTHYLLIGEIKRNDIYKVLLLILVISLFRAQGVAYFLMIPVLLYLGVRCKSFSIFESIIISIVVILLGGLLLYWYGGVLKTYVSTSSMYLMQDNINPWMSSFIGKFLSSFGLRQSFLTVWNEAIDKPIIYHYARLSIGIICFAGFWISLRRAFRRQVFSIVVMAIYVVSLIAAWKGVSFERYFLGVNFIFFHEAIRSVFLVFQRHRVVDVSA